MTTEDVVVHLRRLDGMHRQPRQSVFAEAADEIETLRLKYASALAALYPDTEETR